MCNLVSEHTIFSTVALKESNIFELHDCIFDLALKVVFGNKKERYEDL